LINGVTKIVITKADILNSFEEFGVCTHYKYDNKETKDLPYDMVNKNIQPTTITFKSWGNIDATKPLPTELKEYVDYLEKYLNVPVSMVSNGPGSEQLDRFDSRKIVGVISCYCVLFI
jgi:adenylosuccinate synthase